MKKSVVVMALLASVLVINVNAQQAAPAAPLMEQQVTIKSLSVQSGEILMVNGYPCVVTMTQSGPVIAPVQPVAVTQVAPAQPRVIAAPQPGYTVVQQAPQVVAQQPQVVQQGPSMGERVGSAARSAVGGAAQGAIYETMTGGKAGKGAAAGAASGAAGNVLGQGLDALFGKDRVTR